MTILRSLSPAADGTTTQVINGKISVVTTPLVTTPLVTTPLSTVPLSAAAILQLIGSQANDGSSASTTIIATGATAARTLPDRASDTMTVADFGVSAGTPTVDQTAAFQGAQNAVQATGGVLRVNGGTYQLAGNVYTADTETWLFGPGVTLTGAGQIDAVTDSSALPVSGSTIARLLSKPTNEFGLHVSMRHAPSNSTIGTEKANFYGKSIQNDPSTYDSNGNILVIRDAVIYEAGGSIPAGNLTGRIWGINVGVGPDAGGDGYAVAGEFGILNNSGNASGQLGTKTSKIGVHVVAYGNSTATAAIALSQNGTTFQDGFVAQTNAVSAGGRALSVRPVATTRSSDIAYIGMDGSASFTSLTVNGVPITSGGSGGATAGSLADGTTTSASGGHLSVIGQTITPAILAAVQATGRVTISGSRGSATAAVLESVLTVLAAAGFINDATTA